MTTEEGSIKAVSDEPEEPEEPVPNDFNVPFLPEGTEPTFDNYLNHDVEDLNGDVTALEGVSFYTNDDDGNPQEIYRIKAPEDGFGSTDELLDTFDQAVEDGAFDAAAEDDGTLDLMVALSVPDDIESSMPEEEEIDLTELDDAV